MGSMCVQYGNMGLQDFGTHKSLYGRAVCVLHACPYICVSQCVFSVYSWRLCESVSVLTVCLHMSVCASAYVFLSVTCVSFVASLYFSVCVPLSV